MGYDYQKRDVGDVKESAEANDAKWLAYIKAGIKTWSPKAGIVHRVRFMYPTYAGRRKAIGYRVTVHPNVGPDDISFLSLSAMKDAPDPVSERLSDARRDGDADEKWAKALKEKDYLVTFIIDLDDMDSGVQLWVMPDKANAALDRACIIDGVVVEIEHPEFGRTVEVEAVEKHARDKSFSWTECEFHVSERESWISEDPDEQKTWEDFIKANPLDQCIRFEDYDTILEALGEVSHGRGSRDDDDRPQSRSARRGGGSRDESPRRSTRGESSRRSSRDEAPRRSRETPTEQDDGRDAGDPNRPGWTDDEPEVEAPTRSRRRTREPEPDNGRDLERDTGGRGLPERDDGPADRGPARRDTSEDTVRHRSPQHSGEPSGHVEERPARRSRSRSEPAAETERPTRRTRSSSPPAESREEDRPPDEELAPRRRTRSRTADTPQADAPPSRRRTGP